MKDKLVCPFCETEIKELPKGLEIKYIIKITSAIIKALKEIKNEKINNPS